jgi:hypothetical protein
MSEQNFKIILEQLEKIELIDCNDCYMKIKCMNFCNSDMEAEKLSEITSIKDWGFCKLAHQYITGK